MKKKTIELTQKMKDDIAEAFFPLEHEKTTPRHYRSLIFIDSVIRRCKNSEELRMSLYETADSCINAINVMDACLGLPNANNLDVVRISDQEQYCKQVAMKELIRKK